MYAENVEEEEESYCRLRLNRIFFQTSPLSRLKHNINCNIRHWISFSGLYSQAATPIFENVYQLYSLFRWIYLLTRYVFESRCGIIRYTDWCDSLISVSGKVDHGRCCAYYIQKQAWSMKWSDPKMDVQQRSYRLSRDRKMNAK